MALTEYEKARLFDKLVEEANRNGHFEEVSPSGRGYYRIHVWAANKNTSFEDAVIDLLFT